ncbi:hypothetical protein [Xanthomonas fragariae]|uniref:hypothetical protein n=1 Tax=Xanthomonas fragariae TaxID=48664 RepID=UPI00131EFA23|nr:hypothetical protein [Xanthomonas fragariae]
MTFTTTGWPLSWFVKLKDVTGLMAAGLIPPITGVASLNVPCGVAGEEKPRVGLFFT